MKHFYIDVSDILAEIGSEKTIEKNFDLQVLRAHGQDIFLSKPIHLDVRLTNAGDRLLAEGRVKGEVRLECSRCLTEYCANFSVDLKESFCHKGQCEGEEDVLEFVGDKIDIAAAINQSLHLWVPIKNLCSEDCRGLCSKCGVNLNEASCDCTKEGIDPRLAVLKDYLTETDD